MTTTTLTAVIAHLVTVLEGLTPSPSTPLFRRSVAPHRPLRTWIPDAGGNVMLRKFEVRRDGSHEDLAFMDPSARLVSAPLVVTVAYVPKLSLGDSFTLEAVVEADAAQIRNAIFDVGGLSGSGHRANFVSVLGLDQADERIWFQDFAVEAQLYIAQ